MADDPKDDPQPKAAAKAVPLGAQILRKLNRGLTALSEEVTTMAGSLDACEAKDAIGGLVGSIGTMTGEIGKNWGRYYKDLDIDEADEPEPDPDDSGAKSGDEPADDDDDADVAAALAALDDLDDGDEPADDDDDEGLSDEEKKAVALRIAKIESQIKHQERLAAKNS